MTWRDKLAQNENHIILTEDLVGISDQDRNDLTYKCQTDLFFLSNNILRSRKQLPFLKKVHGGICDALLHKYPTSSAVSVINSKTQFAYHPPEVRELEKWSSVKERVILSSRGTLKSTIEANDFVQLILCEPNIRIVVLSGKQGLAKTNLRLAASHFQTNAVLGFLFEPWVRDIDSFITVEEFTSPAREGVNYRDPTVQIGTFGSVKAGIHAEYLALDDCTNEINQATPELVEKSIQSYDDLDPLVEPGGYVTFTGTRWAIDDLPEHIHNRGAEMEEETGRQHVVYFCQPIWRVKKATEDLPPETPDVRFLAVQSARDQREKEHKLVPEDVELLWPEKLSVEFLWPQYRKNPRKFACQYGLTPESVIHGVFTRELLLHQTKQISDCPLPHRSIVVTNWDLSGITGRGDFAVGIVGIWEDTGRLYIIDAVIEKFQSSTSVCSAIVGLFKKWNPDYHRIESANGSELLSGELAGIAKMANLDRAFIPGWDPPSNVKDAKYTRVMLLPSALERNEIQFFAGIPCLDKLYEMFEKFGRSKKSSSKLKDDGPDCLAQLYEKWKNAIGPKNIAYLTPSGEVVDFMSELPDPKPNVDIHANENVYADIEFLKGFTAPHSGM